jgi:hypothetical protein
VLETLKVLIYVILFHNIPLDIFLQYEIFVGGPGCRVADHIRVNLKLEQVKLFKSQQANRIKKHQCF